MKAMKRLKKGIQEKNHENAVVHLPRGLKKIRWKSYA
jgi:hypothetical protein